MVEKSLARLRCPGARLSKSTVAIISQRGDAYMLDAQSGVGPCVQRRNDADTEPVEWSESRSAVSNTQKVKREVYATAGSRLDNNVWLAG